MSRCFIYIVYFVCLFYIVWFFPGETKSQVTINAVPFETIRLYITAFFHGYVPFYIIIGNLIGNIILFIPIGILISRHLRHMGKVFMLFISIYFPVYIEVVQLFLHFAGYRTRSVDVDDVLLNMVGILIGYYVAKRYKKKKDLY